MNQVLVLNSYAGPILGNGANMIPDVVLSFAVPAGSLATEGDALRIVLAGAALVVSDTRIAGITVNEQPLEAVTLTANSSGWRLQADLVRTSATTSRMTKTAMSESGPVHLSMRDAASIVVDWSQVVTIGITLQNASNPTPNSLTLGIAQVLLLKAP